MYTTIYIRPGIRFIPPIDNQMHCYYGLMFVLAVCIILTLAVQQLPHLLAEFQHFYPKTLTWDEWNHEN